MGFIEKLFGTYSEREVKRLGSVVDKIESLDKSMQKLSDDELKSIKLQNLKKDYQKEKL